MAPTRSSKTAQISPNPSNTKNIVFFHPDLGIGGAERLIVDAAVGLQELGHKVTIYTSHCDPRHCFDEARDGTLDVRVRGNTIFPPSILNRFHILVAILRQIHLIFAITVSSDELRQLRPDLFIVDQLSACVPLLRWLFPGKQRTLFYCHFPDQLLVQDRRGGVKKAYRFLFDWFEGWSMGASDRIVVNSNFTKGIAKGVFPDLEREFEVIYPCVNSEVSQRHEVEKEKPLWDGKYRILLSINRFERKKDVGLAIRAYAALSVSERKGTRLVLAGGYDSRVSENVHHHKELVKMAEDAGLKTATATTVPTALAIPADTEVLFLLSVPGPFKETLLQNAKLLLYTPTNEHFGIVPVEAMQHGIPVLASNTGGPRETIVDGETGWLRDVDKIEEWTTVIRRVLNELTASQIKAIGESGQQRVKEHFTRPKMALRFQENITAMIKEGRSHFVEQQDVIIGLGLMGIFVASLVVVIVRRMIYVGADGRASEFARIPRKATKSGFPAAPVMPGMPLRRE